MPDVSRSRVYGRLLRLGIAGLSIACLVGQGVGQTARDPLAAATTQVRAGQYDAAISTVKHALATHPSDHRLWTVEGIALSLKGDDKQALVCLRKALNLSPGFPMALQAEATVLARRNDAAVIPVLKEILRSAPQDTTAHEMLGLAEAQHGDCASALTEFSAAGLGPISHMASLQHHAACLLQTKQYSEAVEAFQKILSSHPNDRDSQYNLAVAQLDANDAKAAAATLAPLLVETNDVDVLLLGADTAEQQSDTPQAVALLRRAIVAEPERGDSYVRFAELCMAHESYQAGVEMVTAGISRLPHDPLLFLARGLLYGGMAQYDQAEADFRSAELYDVHHGTGAYGVGLIEAQRNNPAEALRIVRSSLKLHPDDAQLHLLLGKLLWQEGSKPGSSVYVEATQEAKDAVRLNPNLVGARNLMAQIDMESGQAADAVQQSRAALAIDPDDSQALYRLMRALRATGDDAGAQAVGRKVAAQHQQSRDDEQNRLRYRIEVAGSPAAGSGKATVSKQ